MKTELHPANERGHASHGWLDSYHSFSFATYFNPAREQFGCLRVLNDDTVAGGTGFDLHPHNNMEIISIVLEGALEHRDSMGNIQVINPGEVQVMSAGTGIYHAEYNHSKTSPVKFFQIWIFPREKGLKPRYDQIFFHDLNTPGNHITLVTPDNCRQEGALWIHQDAFISMANLVKDSDFEYRLRIPANAVFVMTIDGTSEVDGNVLNSRDAIAVSEAESFRIHALSGSRILFIEIPKQ
jgi:hypothetical protein